MCTRRHLSEKNALRNFKIKKLLKQEPEKPQQQQLLLTDTGETGVIQLHTSRAFALETSGCVLTLAAVARVVHALVDVCKRGNLLGQFCLPQAKNGV